MYIFKRALNVSRGKMRKTANVNKYCQSVAIIIKMLECDAQRVREIIDIR